MKTKRKMAALCLCALCLCASSCAARTPDPMGTGAESTRYVFWVLGLRVGPPLHHEQSPAPGCAWSSRTSPGPATGGSGSVHIPHHEEGESEADRPSVWLEK